MNISYQMPIPMGAPSSEFTAGCADIADHTHVEDVEPAQPANDRRFQPQLKSRMCRPGSSIMATTFPNRT